MNQIHMKPVCRRVDNYLKLLDRDEIVNSIFKGLTSSPKQISSRFFYDSAGSELFKKITSLPEYYLTRSEVLLLKKLSAQIGEELRDSDIVEIGSGDCAKISIILKGVPLKNIGSLRYMPVDVSRHVIEESSRQLVRNFPGLVVRGISANFVKQLHLIPKERKRLFLFLGSTVGNFTPRRAEDYFRALGGIMQSGEMLVLGADTVKEKSVLEDAYNDSEMITEKFNRNILNVVNDYAGTNFVPEEFEHVAFYNEAESRIEMHLRASRETIVSSEKFPGDIFIEKGEMIHTEYSHKFTRERIAGLAYAGGLKIEKIYTDKDNSFFLVRMTKL